jgi:hypothetical protein
VTPDLTIDPASGALQLGGLDVTVEAGAARDRVERRLADLIRGRRDHGNGYHWLYLGGLSFGGWRCDVGLCFFEDRLAEASWSATPPERPTDAGWPSPEEIDRELAFVREELKRQLGRDASEASLAWGEVWSVFDPKGGMAANGLRYKGWGQDRG